MKNKGFYILLFLCSLSAIGQVDEDKRVLDEPTIVARDTVVSIEVYDPLAPSRAAFYSAAIPGLGQAYNKKYWKIPIIYAGMATGVYFYIQNQNDYTRFRDAYKRRLAGFTDDEFFGDGTEAIISNERLINAQRGAQKNKDYSIITVIAFYALNIIDANVDAHLRQYDISDDLSVGPKFDLNKFTTKPNYTLSLTYTLK